MTLRFRAIIIVKSIIFTMSSHFETFNYFIDDVLSSNASLLKYELDVLLMQHLFNTIDLEEFKDINIKEDINVA